MLSGNMDPRSGGKRKSGTKKRVETERARFVSVNSGPAYRRKFSYFRGNVSGKPDYEVLETSLEKADERARKAGYDPEPMGLAIAHVGAD